VISLYPHFLINLITVTWGKPPAEPGRKVTSGAAQVQVINLAGTSPGKTFTVKP